VNSICGFEVAQAVEYTEESQLVHSPFTMTDIIILFYIFWFLVAG
jgi:hypothetical protein